MPCTSCSDALYYWYGRLVPIVLSISIPPKLLLLRPLHGIPYSLTWHTLLLNIASLPSKKVEGRWKEKFLFHLRKCLCLKVIPEIWWKWKENLKLFL